MDLMDYLSWAEARGIELSPHVKVSESNLGGLGLLAKDDIPEESIIVRIPKTCALDLNTALLLSNSLKKEDSSGTASTVINAFLQAGGHSSEMIILRSFVWAFALLKKHDKTGFLSHLKEIDPYIQVLLTTNILNVDESIRFSDRLIQSLVAEKEQVRRDYNKLVKDVPEIEDIFSFKTAFQLHQAVKSRVLEIPRSSDTESGEEDDSFVTDVTLVPVLDFANHSLNNSSVFDVDRASDDIVLRLVRAVCVDEEITIRYDSTNCIEMFLRTYGFVPEPPSVLEWHFDKLNEELNEVNCTRGQEYSKIAKWLQVDPVVHLTREEDKSVSLLPENFRLPLLLIPGLQYYPSWSSEVKDIAEEFEVSEEELPAILENLTLQETRGRAVVASDTIFGVTYNNAYVSLSNLLSQTGIEGEKAVRELAQHTVNLLRRAAAASRPCSSSIELNFPQNGVLRSYLELKQDTLGRFLDPSNRRVVFAVEEAIRNLGK